MCYNTNNMEHYQQNKTKKLQFKIQIVKNQQKI